MGRKIFLFVLAIILFSFLASAQTDHSVDGHEEIVDVVYFYGDGCPHCADLEEFLDEIKGNYNLNITAYEVYNNAENRALAQTLAKQYGESFRGVPMTFIGEDVFIGFSSSIGNEIELKIQLCETECCDSPFEIAGECKQEQEVQEKLTILGIIGYAIADSVNPCALAVLAMVLVALLTRNPDKKRKVLTGGFAFITAVFITYIIYGIIIIMSFSFIKDSFASISPYVRILFSLVAILLGLLNIKDSIKYKPGSVGTEMPMTLRPVVKKLINNITRPRGAFIIGIFVTLFLLPCTIGPYIIAGERLSELMFINTLPWLILYNLIFILPMIFVVMVVYFGYATVDNVVGWKEENIKYLHLIAGAVLVILGLLMLIGWI